MFHRTGVYASISITEHNRNVSPLGNQGHSLFAVCHSLCLFLGVIGADMDISPPSVSSDGQGVSPRHPSPRSVRFCSFLCIAGMVHLVVPGRPEQKEEEDDEMRCGICDDRGDEEEECQGCEGCGPVIEVWPQIGEEVHTNSCPHRLMECVECETVMAQYHLLEHECPVMDKPMQTRDIDWADHEDESICGCERNRKKEKVKEKENNQDIYDNIHGNIHLDLHIYRETWVFCCFFRWTCSQANLFGNPSRFLSHWHGRIFSVASCFIAQGVMYRFRQWSARETCFHWETEVMFCSRREEANLFFVAH